MSRTRKLLFGTTLGLYAVIVVAVLIRTDLVRLDWQVMLFRPYKQWPEVHAFLDYFVVLGQRGPTAVLVAAWLGWRSWRQRTLRPLLVLGTVAAAAQRHCRRREDRARQARPALRDRGRIGRTLRRRRYIPVRSHRERRGDLGHSGLSRHHAARPPGALGRRRVLRSRSRRDHRLPRYALGQRRAARLGRRAADPAGAALVRAGHRHGRGPDPGLARPAQHREDRPVLPPRPSPPSRGSRCCPPAGAFRPRRWRSPRRRSTARPRSSPAVRAAPTSSGTGVGAARLHHTATRQHPLRTERAPVTPQSPAGPRRPYGDRSQRAHGASRAAREVARPGRTAPAVRPGRCAPRAGPPRRTCGPGTLPRVPGPRV